MRLIGINLRLAGYQVITAASGEESLKLLESEKPDMMVLDILMPGIDGFEVLRRLRTVSELPVIAVSAHTSAREESLSLGANDFLAKPFLPDELVKRIKALLDRKEKATD